MDFTVGDKGVLAFGPFLLDPVRRRLSLRGEPIKLTPKSVELLLYLVENPGRIVEKDELLSVLWGSRVVEEGNLSQTVFLLRRALRCGGMEGAIVTAPGRGYRFTAGVSIVSGEAMRAGPLVAITSAARPDSPRLAKLSPPRLPRTIPRPQLLAKLRAGCERRMLWVSGPPGAGKTTSICSFLQEEGVPTIWYSVDPEDRDPANFFFYLGKAFDAAFPGETALPLLTAEYLQNLSAFTRRTFRLLAGRISPPFALVLDNFQEASDAAPLNQIVRDAAVELGAGINLIVISREEPAAAFARLRANQEMAFVGWEALRLTAAESAEIVTQHDPSLVPDAADIHAKSGGWAAGLTMLLQGGWLRRSAAGRLPSPADRLEPPQAMFDYFATELFESVAENTKRVLLSTAYLTRITESAAQFLSDRLDAGTHLEAMARRRMFTDVHVADDIYFQYHALLREFLCRQLDHLYTEEERTQLMHRSARMANQMGNPEAAATLYEKAGDFDSASAILVSQAPLLFAQGRWQLLQGWLHRQPPSEVERVPWLAYWLGVCTCWTDQVVGRDILKRAYATFAQSGDAMGQIMAVCAIVDGHLMDWLDMSGVEYWIDILQTMVETNPQLSSGALELRVYSVMLAALAAFRPWHELLSTCQARVEELCRNGERYGIAVGPRLMGAADLVQSLAWGTCSNVADAIASEFQLLTAYPDVTPLQQCKWITSRSYTYLVNGDVAGYRQSWRTAEHIASEAGLGFMVAISQIQVIQSFLLNGELEEADRRLRQITLKPSDKPVQTVLFYFTHAWLALLQRKFPEALAHAEYVCNVPCAVVRTAQGTVTRCIYAASLAACGAYDKALSKAQEASSWFGNPSQSVLQYVSLLTEADVLYGMGRPGEARPVLQKAFATGRRGNHFLVTPWLPDMMSRLTTLALESGIETDYVAELVRQRNL